MSISNPVLIQNITNNTTEAVVQADYAETDPENPTFVLNKPELGTAALKDAGTDYGSVPVNPISQDNIDDPRTRAIRLHTQNWINGQIAIETRLRDTRSELSNLKNFLHGDTLSGANLATIAEIERKARFRAAVRAVGAALELEEGATSEDGAWPLLPDFEVQALSPFWTNGVSQGAINGLTSTLSGKTSPAEVDAQIQAFYDNIAPETLALLAQLSADLTNHESMEATILAAVTAEQAARIADVDSEEATRIVNDTTNANAIIAETAARLAADTTENARAIAAENTVQAFAIQRANHTGTQLASTISDFSAAATSVARSAIALTTTGSGASAYNAGTGALNIPTPSASTVAVNAPLTNAGTTTAANLILSAATTSTPGSLSAADFTKLSKLLPIAYVATTSVSKSGSTTAEASIIPTGVGTLLVPTAIFDAVGYSFEFKASGIYTNVLTGIVTLRIKLGSQITLSAACSFPLLSSKAWRASGEGTVRSGRVLLSTASIEWDTGSGTDGVQFASSNITVAAGDQTASFTAQWNLVLGGASITTDQLKLKFEPAP